MDPKLGSAASMATHSDADADSDAVTQTDPEPDYMYHALMYTSSDTDADSDSMPWWQNTEDFSGYPEGYKRFLIYQAKRLREHRPRLQRSVERHKGDTDVLKAHVENQAQDLRDDVLTAQREDNARIEAHLKDSIDFIETQLNKSIETQLNEKTEEIRQRQRRHRKKMKQQLFEITNMLKQMQQQMQRTSESAGE